MSARRADHDKGKLDFSTLDTLFGFRLRLAQIKLFQHFRTTLTRFDVTPGQAGVLILTRDNPGISQSRLARAMQVERATLGQTLEGLVARSLVSRERNTGDRRAYALRLSPEGEKFVAALLPAIRAHEAEVASNLTDDELEQLRSLLSKFLG